MMQTTPKPLIRSLHHMACTGGTLISRCIAAMPNVRLLSEVDPLSPMTHLHPFLPADLTGLMKFGSRPPSEKTVLRVFMAGLRCLADETRAEGGTLVLRDHSHSHFFHGPYIPERPSLREIIQTDFKLSSILTIRHPLDSYLSVVKNKWMQFQPGTLEEYARRSHVFLDHYADLTPIRYEDFVSNPTKVMPQICQTLDLPYNPQFQNLFSHFPLSGDSGRRGDVIAPRPRRSLSEEILAEIQKSPSYQSLCARMEYDPKPKPDKTTKT